MLCPLASRRPTDASKRSRPPEIMPDWLIEVMKITPTPHFVSFSQSVLYRATSLDVVCHYDGVFWHLTDAIQDHNCQFPVGPAKANRFGNPLCGLRVGRPADRRGLDPRLILVTQRGQLRVRVLGQEAVKRGALYAELLIEASKRLARPGGIWARS